MKVLVDTSVWSVALCHSFSTDESEEIKELLYSLIEDAGVAMIGPIRQELLSGIKLEAEFNQLKKRLEPFRDVPLETDDFILAANFLTAAVPKVLRDHILIFWFVQFHPETNFLFLQPVKFLSNTKSISILCYSVNCKQNRLLENNEPKTYKRP